MTSAPEGSAVRERNVAPGRPGARPRVFTSLIGADPQPTVTPASIPEQRRRRVNNPGNGDRVASLRKSARSSSSTTRAHSAMARSRRRALPSGCGAHWPTTPARSVLPLEAQVLQAGLAICGVRLRRTGVHHPFRHVLRGGGTGTGLGLAPRAHLRDVSRVLLRVGAKLATEPQAAGALTASGPGFRATYGESCNCPCRRSKNRGGPDGHRLVRPAGRARGRDPRSLPRSKRFRYRPRIHGTSPRGARPPNCHRPGTDGSRGPGARLLASNRPLAHHR